MVFPVINAKFVKNNLYVGHVCVTVVASDFCVCQCLRSLREDFFLNLNVTDLQCLFQVYSKVN